MKKEILSTVGTLTTAGLYIKPKFIYNKIDLKKMYKSKEWDRYILYNNRVAFEVGIYVTAHLVTVFVSYYDLKNDTCINRNLHKVTLLNGFDMPSSIETGDIYFFDKNMSLYISRQSDTKKIKCDFPNYDSKKNLFANIAISESNCENFASIQPSPQNNFQFVFKQKRNCAYIDGTLKLGGKESFFTKGNTFSAFSWGRGNYLPKGKYIWGSLITKHNDVDFGFNIGYNEDTPNVHENILNYDDKLEELGIVSIKFKKNDPKKKWTIFSKEKKANFSFIPFSIQNNKFKFGTKWFKKTIYFGRFSGCVLLSNKKTINIKNELGIMEEITD